METLIILGILLTGRPGGGEGVVLAVIGAIICTIVFWVVPKIISSGKDAASKILVEINPNDVKNLIKLGQKEVSKGNYNNAIDYYSRALNNEQFNIEALASIAFAYHMTKDYENSKKYIELFQEKFDGSKDDNSMALIMTYLYGHICLMEGKLEQSSNCKHNAMTLGQVDGGVLDIINRLNLY